MICILWQTFARAVWHGLGAGGMSGVFVLFLGYSQSHFSKPLPPVIPWKSFTPLEGNFSCTKTVNATTGGQRCLLQIGTSVEIRMKSTQSSIPKSLGAATRVGSQSSTERRKILLFLKWEDAHFSFRKAFSFSPAAQLLHSSCTYADIDDSLELLSRTHFPQLQYTQICSKMPSPIENIEIGNIPAGRRQGYCFAIPPM